MAIPSSSSSFSSSLYLSCPTEAEKRQPRLWRGTPPKKCGKIETKIKPTQPTGSVTAPLTGVRAGLGGVG